MGNSVQGGQLRAAPDVRAHLLDLDADLIYQDTLGSYKLFKVMHCVHERIGKVVVKLFLRAEEKPNDAQLLAVQNFTFHGTSEIRKLSICVSERMQITHPILVVLCTF